MVLGFGLFSRAGATGHVFFVENGKRRDKGLAYSGIYGPGTAIAVVPTIPQIVDFQVPARTKDNQDVMVTGSVKAALSPAEAVASFDFTVDSKTGGYQARWNDDLRSLVMEQLLTPIKAQAKTAKLAEIVSEQPEMEKAIMDAIAGKQEALRAAGVRIDSVSVAEIVSEDDDLSEALGAKERESLLAAADKATHERQMQAVENAREVKTFEAETALTLEQERGKLVKEQGVNKLEEAETDAKAIAARMGPFTELDPTKVLALAFYKMGEQGRVGTLNVSPELLESLKTGLAGK